MLNITIGSCLNYNCNCLTQQTKKELDVINISSREERAKVKSELEEAYQVLQLVRVELAIQLEKARERQREEEEHYQEVAWCHQRAEKEIRHFKKKLDELISPQKPTTTLIPHSQWNTLKTKCRELEQHNQELIKRLHEVRERSIIKWYSIMYFMGHT